MNRIETELPGVCVLEPVVHGDDRGFFIETYNRRTFERIGIVREWVQDNFSRSHRGVLRGLHYQIARPQAKLVHVTAGEVLDVAVDVRRGSPTFGRWTSVRLSAENRRVLFVPEGFAHGFYVISEGAEIAYKCSDFYTPRHERGLIWNDPDLGIPWPIYGNEQVTISPRDAAFARLNEIPGHDLPTYEPDEEK